MLSYIVGDDLGSIKRIKFTQKETAWSAESTPLLSGGSKSKAIQKLAVFSQAESETLLAVARADGSASVSSLTDEGADLVAEWKETRFRDGQKYVGIAAGSSGIYTCTSNGALRLAKPRDDDQVASDLATLPMRLSEWRLSGSEESFAYAGDEVELSVWNTELAFSAKNGDKTVDDPPKKRKRNDELLPGEIWRAKNLPNDNLNLRQPVRNTAFSFLKNSTSPTQHHIVVGTQLGDVRRYDTRAARRPVSNWVGISKVGGVGIVENGSTENELFVADKGCNLLSLDLRNGKVSYSYKGLAGAVTTVAPSPSFLASGSQDRFLRIHSTFPPPPQAGQQQEKKGEILDKFYLKVVPTVVVAEHPGENVVETGVSTDDGDESEQDDVWDQMEGAESDAEVQHKTSHKSKRRKA